MISLTKSGIVRVVETPAEAQRLIAAGYKAIPISDEVNDLRASFTDFTVPRLVALCKERGIEIPKGTNKKDEFIALIMQNTPQSEGEPCDE